MGGLCFILGILATLGIVWVMYSPKLPEVLGMPQLQAGMLVLFLAFGSGLIGFLDDFIKVVKHRNLGLTEAQKMILQIALTFGFMFGLHSLGLLTTQVQFPIFGLVDMGLLYYPIAFFGIIFLVNAVNLTDGLDGLASSVTAVVAVFFTIASLALGGGIEPVTAAVAGALLGFLLFNVHPAQVFMGDTGSLALGGFVAGSAYMLRMPWIILVVGLIYLIEVLSVIIQVTYFKKTGGKRFFKMAPIHHHFELCGWSETRIVAVFSTVTMLLCIAGLLLIR